MKETLPMPIISDLLAVEFFSGPICWKRQRIWIFDYNCDGTEFKGERKWMNFIEKSIYLDYLYLDIRERRTKIMNLVQVCKPILI